MDCETRKDSQYRYIEKRRAFEIESSDALFIIIETLSTQEDDGQIPATRLPKKWIAK